MHHQAVFLPVVCALALLQVRSGWTHVSTPLSLPLSVPLPDVAAEWSRHSSLSSIASADLPTSFFEPTQRFSTTVEVIEITTLEPTWAEVCVSTGP